MTHILLLDLSVYEDKQRCVRS